MAEYYPGMRPRDTTSSASASRTGAGGHVIIGSWLVEAKQSVIENTAPVLTRLFTPLFTVLLLVLLVTLVWTGSPINVKREVLIGFDLLLVLVVVSARAVDWVALWAIAARISEFGFTPNRVAALGENLILLVNLAWSAWLYARFLRHRGGKPGRLCHTRSR